MEGVYLAGEPGTTSEASLYIGFEFLSTDWDQEAEDYDEALYDEVRYWFTPGGDSVDYNLHLSFNQVDMRTGSFSRVIRHIDARDKSEIELSKNELIDKNDYIGLI